MKTLRIKVQTNALPLSATAVRAIQNFEHYDWVLFTSKNAVAHFMKAYGRKSIKPRKGAVPPRSSPPYHIAAVGPETADALRSVGCIVTLVPEQHTVEAIITALGKVQNKRVLFPRSAIAPHQAVHTLRKNGARVRVIPLYTTVPLRLSLDTKHELLAGAYEKLSFSSPSGVQSLLTQLLPQEQLRVKSIPAMCIGPTTLQAAKKAGFKHAYIA